jgi:hypothetical protein
MAKPPTPSEPYTRDGAVSAPPFSGSHTSSMPKFHPTPVIDAALCRFPLPKDLARMRDMCDPVSIIDLKHQDAQKQSSGDYMKQSQHTCFDDDLLALSSPNPSQFDHAYSVLRCKKAPLYYFGKPYNVGDIVLVKGRTDDQYFGRIDHFFVNEYEQKFFSMTWMLPKKASMTKLDHIRSISHSDLEEGNPHHGIESMDCIIGVILDVAASKSAISDMAQPTAISGSTDNVSAMDIILSSMENDTQSTDWEKSSTQMSQDMELQSAPALCV